MTNTGKTLIIGLVLADLVVCGYLFYPREDRKSAPPAEAALTAPDTTDSRSYGESHVIAGSIARPGSPDASANANASAKTSNGTIVSGGDVRAPAPAAPMPTMPAATAAPATTLANIPAAEMQPQAQLAQPTQPQTQTQVQPQPQSQPQPQPQRYSARSKATQHAEDARSHEDLRRHGSSDVGALMTELLVRESAKLDPSLPPPPASPAPPPSSVTDREPINRRNTNPVAAAMTDQLVKESARVTPASGAQRQPGTQ
jgi:hypothetical protein